MTDTRNIRLSVSLPCLLITGVVATIVLMTHSGTPIFPAFVGLCLWALFVLTANVARLNQWTARVASWSFLRKRSILIQRVVTTAVSIWVRLLLLQGVVFSLLLGRKTIDALLIEPEKSPVIGGVFFLILGFAVRFLQQLDQISEEKASLLSRRWSLIIFYTSVISAAFILIEGSVALELSHYVAIPILLLIAVLILETVLRGFVEMYQTRSAREKAAALGDPRCFGLLFRNSDSPVVSESNPLLDVSVSQLWFVREFRRAAIPFVSLALMLAWLSTAVNIVPPGHEAMRETFGKIGFAKPVGAGLHFSLPVPLGRFHSVNTQEVREIVIGFESDTGEPILWAEPHYVGEKMLLTEDGDQLLTLGIPILYRINDLGAWLSQSSNVMTGVERIASREVQRHSLEAAFFETITGNRTALENSLKESIQEQLDHNVSGVEIIRVCLRDVHPPVETVRSYQDVVSAEEEKLAMIHRAQATYEEELPLAEMESFRLRNEANTWKQQRMASATGTAGAFAAKQGSYRLSPDLYRLRSQSEVADLTMSQMKKLVIDEKFSGSNNAMIDARRMLSLPSRRAKTLRNETLVPTSDQENSEPKETPFRPIEIDVP